MIPIETDLTFWMDLLHHPKCIPLIFNSRIETISSKPYWKNLFIKNKCLIPATAFYEWKMIDKTKIPHKISFESMPLFFIAGIYLKINDGYFASMITTAPNTAIAKVHNRMPVIFCKEDGIRFLTANEKDALALCNPLDDNIPVDIDIANEILTQRQRDFLGYV